VIEHHHRQSLVAEERARDADQRMCLRRRRFLVEEDARWPLAARTARGERLHHGLGRLTPQLDLLEETHGEKRQIGQRGERPLWSMHRIENPAIRFAAAGVKLGQAPHLLEIPRQLVGRCLFVG
jgi:hypothetical protein